MKLSEIVHAQPKSFVLLTALAMVCAVAYIDFRTRWEISFFVIYAVPIFAVAWRCSKTVTFGFIVLCGVMSWAVNLQIAPSPSIHAWRSTNRFVSFLFVGIAGSALRTQRKHFRSRLAALERSRELEQEIIRVSEREQRRIGQDLHDSICQSLAAIDCAAGLMKSKLQAKTLAEVELAEEIQASLQKTLLETRSLARGIFPVQLEQEGLAVALEELVAVTNRLHQVAVSLDISGNIALKDPETAMHLYRIAQEALGNALKHARAKAIAISLRQDGRDVVLAISDDGIGFSPAQPHTGGMGLRTIRYRAQMIGADVEMNRNTLGGTVVRCSLTLPNDNKA